MNFKIKRFIILWQKLIHDIKAEIHLPDSLVENAAFDRCVDFLVRMYEKYGHKIDEIMTDEKSALLTEKQEAC